MAHKKSLEALDRFMKVCGTMKTVWWSDDFVRRFSSSITSDSTVSINE
jgi:hypothetical protein